MEQKYSSRGSWLRTAVHEIRFAPDREAVRQELQGHIEDKVADLLRIFPGMTLQEAEERALSQMGDPEEIGKELGRIHKPWWGYLWIASKVVLTASIIIMFGILGWYGDDAFLGDDLDAEWRDSDNLPRIVGVGTREEYYLPGEDPGQLLAIEPNLERDANGQTVSLRRAALWQEETLALYVYLRVDCWRFWERGRLQEDWLSVTDSCGNSYPLGDKSPWLGQGGHLNSLTRGGFGFCHWGAELKLGDVDPRAEWVRLDYGAGEPIFSFVLDLKEGAVS